MCYHFYITVANKMYFDRSELYNNNSLLNQGIFDVEICYHKSAFTENF